MLFSQLLSDQIWLGNLIRDVINNFYYINQGVEIQQLKCFGYLLESSEPGNKITSLKALKRAASCDCRTDVSTPITFQVRGWTKKIGAKKKIICLGFITLKMIKTLMKVKIYVSR